MTGSKRTRCLAGALLLALIPLAAGAGEITLPPVGATPDYQLGGAYAPPPGVGAVGRDRSDLPAPGIYSICYVNGFQTQPGEAGLWPAELLLQDGQGPIVDPDWPDELILDTSTPAKRAAIFTIVQPWIEGCAASGFQAIEFDNLDSWTRFPAWLAFADNLAMASLYVAEAHRLGLAAAQKNAVEKSASFRDVAGFDFAISEECAVWDECDGYVEAYGDHVIDIEYPDDLPAPFQEVCLQHPEIRSMVLRDMDLTTPNRPGYVFEACARADLVFADGFEAD